MLPEISVSSQLPPHDADGYSSSKWMSECLLEKVAADYNLPVWIHRPTTIIGEGPSESDLMTTIIKYSRLLRAIPRIDGLKIRGSFDLISVEGVSQLLVDKALDSIFFAREHTLRFVHHFNTTKISPSGLKSYFEHMDKAAVTRGLDAKIQLAARSHTGQAGILQRGYHHLLLEAVGQMNKIEPNPTYSYSGDGRLAYILYLETYQTALMISGINRSRRFPL
ncbi:hypothetical protein F5B19DRAFT_496433 [Rostrohypoxylon terebratum]|nr:hypothetical protein F5B19DRAFT_496433 [Rostrohypoxylon terebratum]